MNEALPAERVRHAAESKRADGTARPGALSRAVRRIRQQALGMRPGQLIGSEQQMQAMLGVSRATLRKAAAMVSQEQLIRVQRGHGGGYFAQRPRVDAVSHITAIYLQSRGTNLQEILVAIEPMVAEMGVLAAQNRDPIAVQALRDFQERDGLVEKGYREFLKSEREFSKILGAACGNRVLELFVSTLHEFCGFVGPDQDLFWERLDRVQEYWTRRRLWVWAIIDGDVEMTALAGRRCARLGRKWMEEDRPGGGAIFPHLLSTEPSISAAASRYAIARTR